MSNEEAFEEEDDSPSTEVEGWFKTHGDEFLKFERIPAYARKHSRPDLCAMLYLHDKFGGKGDAVACAAHDEIWLDWEANVLTEEDVIYLHRCGVRYDDGQLAMFV